MKTPSLTRQSQGAWSKGDLPSDLRSFRCASAHKQLPSLLISAGDVLDRRGLGNADRELENGHQPPTDMFAVGE